MITHEFAVYSTELTRKACQSPLVQVLREAFLSIFLMSFFCFRVSFGCTDEEEEEELPVKLPPFVRLKKKHEEKRGFKLSGSCVSYLPFVASYLPFVASYLPFVRLKKNMKRSEAVLISTFSPFSKRSFTKTVYQIQH